MRKAVCAISAMLLSGCVAVGPDYEPPSLNAPNKFVGGATKELRDAAAIAWWTELQDPALNRLVSIGLKQNLDVKTALERIVEAQHNARRFGVVEQQLDGDVDWNARRSETGGVVSEDASLNADAFFVFDLFGEFSRAREQSVAELEAARFQAGTVKLAYLSDVVSAYALVRYFQNAAQVTRETIASQRETLSVVRERAEVQESTQLEIAQAQSLLANAEASLPILVAQARVNTFRLATLLNVSTGEVSDVIAKNRGIPNPKGIENGVPADLLRNRPDIRSAERDLAAATAAVGVTEAQLYPSLRLAGTVGVGETNSWSFGPSLSLPVFDRSLRSANLDVARSRARQAELGYRQTFITAVEEVQVAMTLTEARHAQVHAFQKAVSASERVLNLARRSYEAGVVPVDEVLDADRTRLSDRLDLAQAQSDYVQAWIRQQVATGKGWDVLTGDAVAMLQ